MKLLIKDGAVPPKTIFKLVAVGLSISSLIFFAPFFLFAVLLLSSRSPNPEIMGIIVTILALPIILVTQAALVAVLVNFGLYIYGRFRRITYERE